MTQIPQALGGNVVYIEKPHNPQGTQNTKTSNIQSKTIVNNNETTVYFSLLTSFVHYEVTGTKLVTVEVVDGDEVV